MKVELKSVKYYETMSEETPCFRATIYINGKRAGTAENRGIGGNTHISIEDRDLAREFEKFAKSRPIRVIKLEGHDDMTIEMDGEGLIDELLFKWLDDRDAKLHEKKLLKRDDLEKRLNGLRGKPYTVRFLTGDDWRWVGFARPEQESECKAVMTEKYGEPSEWRLV